jgi:hypothetical protein
MACLQHGPDGQISRYLWPTTEIPGAPYHLLELRVGSYAGQSFLLPDGSKIEQGTLVAELHCNNRNILGLVTTRGESVRSEPQRLAQPGSLGKAGSGWTPDTRPVWGHDTYQSSIAAGFYDSTPAGQYPPSFRGGVHDRTSASLRDRRCAAPDERRNLVHLPARGPDLAPRADSALWGSSGTHAGTGGSARRSPAFASCHEVD